MDAFESDAVLWRLQFLSTSLCEITLEHVRRIFTVANESCTELGLPFFFKAEPR